MQSKNNQESKSDTSENSKKKAISKYSQKSIATPEIAKSSQSVALANTQPSLSEYAQKHPSQNSEIVFDKKEYERQFNEMLKDERIKKSTQTFKIRPFLAKAENSILIAKHHKDIIPNNDEPKKLYWDYWAITISYYSMLYAAKAAILSKGYEVFDHDSAQIALGHLLVPNEIEKEDLEILNQSYKIFEDEYVRYFEDAKKESNIARYSAIKTYTQRRLNEIFSNATKFVAKIALLLHDIK